MSARTVRRRLPSLSGFYGYLSARGLVHAIPVPSGPLSRSPKDRGRGGRVPLIRTPRTLPRVLNPAEVTALLAALRTSRGTAMVHAMLSGGLRRCEVPGLRLADVRLADRRLFIADGKGGRQRVIPVSGRFFTALAAYLGRERPRNVTTDRVLVVLKGPDRGRPLPTAGAGEILSGARGRAGIAHLTCHVLRHTHEPASTVHQRVCHGPGCGWMCSAAGGAAHCQPHLSLSSLGSQPGPAQCASVPVITGSMCHRADGATSTASGLAGS